MKRAYFVCLFLCLTTTFLLSQSNPIPLVSLPLAPDGVPPGSASFMLTVNGAGFVPGAVVNWNGNGLATNFVNHDRLTAFVSDSQIAASATALVTVVNPAPGGGTSNSVPFTIARPTASLTFAASTYSVGNSVVSVAAADFNNDGKMDLAIVNYEGPGYSCPGHNTGSVAALLGNGDGTFTQQWTYDFNCLSGPVQAQSVTVGDFNGDGNLDLAVVVDDVDLEGVRIFLGNGDGTFTYAGSNFARDALQAVQVGDFNGDGKLDFAFGWDVGGNDGLEVALGNGDGTFPTSGGYGNLTVDSQVVGDFNGDGILDLAVSPAINESNPGVSITPILLGNGDGTFTVASSQPSFSGSPTTGDFNGDGILDLVYSSGVLLGNGDGTFTSIGGSLPLAAVTSAADLNGDGKLDLISGTSVLLGNGDGTFQSPVTVPFSGLPESIAVADFSGDGGLDLVSANGDSTITVLLNTSSRFGATTTTLLSSINPSVSGKPVTFTAIVSSLVVTPTGKVQFLNGTTVLATLKLISGVAKYSTSKLPTGANSITAVYEGNSNSSGSTSAPVNQFVLAATTTTLLSSPNPSTSGDVVTFSARVTAEIGAPPYGGTVAFMNGKTLVGTGVLSAGLASFATSALKVGTHVITASYSGDSTFSSSKSKPVKQVIEKDSSHSSP